MADSTQQSDDIFSHITSEMKEYGEGIEIEHGMLVNQGAGMVTPGILIDVRELHAPMFLSIKELRDMADEAEKRTKEAIENS